MTVYYELIAWVGILSFSTAGIHKKKLRRKLIIILGSVGILLVQALRSSAVGHDVKAYLVGYNMVANLNVFAGARVFNYERGYLLYSQLFARLNFSNQLYLAVVALTIIAPITYMLYKNSKMPGLSLLIYITFGLFTFSFSGLRESIAMGLTFLSFNYIQEQKLVKFLVLVGVAGTFHHSALIFLFAYPLYRVRLKSNHFLIIIPVFMFVFIFKSKIYLLLTQLYRGVVGQAVTTNAYRMLIIMAVLFLISYIFTTSEASNLNLNAYKNYLLVVVLFQILAMESNVVMRAAYYYIVFTTLLIPEVIQAQRDIKVRMVMTVIIVIGLIYFFQYQTGKGFLNVSPYHFYWD